MAEHLVLQNPLCRTPQKCFERDNRGCSPAKPCTVDCNVTCKQDNSSPFSKSQSALMHVIAQQQTIPLHLGLLCSVNAAVPGRGVKVWPRLEGPALPKQARGCVGGHQGGFYQEGSRATHGVSQHLPCAQPSGSMRQLSNSLLTWTQLTKLNPE